MALHGEVGGISCKDFAKARTTGAKVVGNVYLAGESPGQSAQCMHGFVSQLHVTPTDWLLLENSDELAENDEHREALDLFLHDLSLQGYDTRVFVKVADRFVVCQKRKRMYIVGLLRPCKYFHVSDYGKFFETVVKLVDMFEMVGPSLPEVMYHDDNPRLRADAEAKLTKTPCMTLTTKELNEQRAAWKALGLRHEHGTRMVRDADRDSASYQALCLRKRTCLEYHQHTRHSKIKELERKLQADEVGQALSPEEALKVSRDKVSFVLVLWFGFMVVSHNFCFRV